MFISKINLFKIFKVDERECKQEKYSAGAAQSCDVIASKNTVNALKSINFGQQKDYVFLQNISIPALNLNANLYMLKNGQKCLIARKDGPCAIKTFFDVGSMNETPNIRGISHYIEHNLFNGSANLKPTEFVQNVNKRGAKYNASTSLNWTDYYIHSPLHKPDDLEKFIAMHADMIARPTFSHEMLEKEKGPVISEIQMMADNPFGSAFNHVLKMLFSKENEEGDLIGGTVQNIENLSRDVVLDYYNTYYNPKDALTVVMGDVDEKKTIELLSKNFADFKNKEIKNKHHEKLIPIKSTIRKDITSSKTQSTMVNIAFLGPKNNENDLPAAMMLYALTGYKNARLTSVINKMNTDIGGMLERLSNNPNDNSAIVFSTGSSTFGAEELLKVLYQKIHEMAHIPLSEKELTVLKKKYKNTFKAQAESNLWLTDSLGKEYLQNKNFDNFKNLEKQIDAMTSQDILNAAKKYLDLNKAAICVVHPEQPKMKNISFTGTTKQDYDIKTYKASNNASFSVLSYPQTNTTVMDITLKADVPVEKPSVIPILKTMLDKGTSLMPEAAFAEIDDLNDLKSRVDTSLNKISFKYTLPKENLNIAFEKFTKNLFYPALTVENFEKAKAEIKNDFYSLPKSAENRAIEAIYAGTPKEYSLRKIVEEIDNVKYEDVVNYYNNFISNASCQVFATGDFSHPELLNSLNQNISLIPKVFSNEYQHKDLNIKELKNTKIVTETQERNQADIMQVFRIKETGNIKDKVAIALLNEVLGGNSNSRLFNDLREKQKLAYRVHSNYTHDNNEGIFTLRIFTTTDNPENPKQSDNLKKSIGGFSHHIEKLVMHNISNEELNAAKLQLKSGLAFDLESTGGKNHMLVNSMNTLYKEKYLSQLYDAIDSATANDIRKIAAYYLTKPSVISIVASEKTLMENESYLKNLGEVQKF